MTWKQNKQGMWVREDGQDRAQDVDRVASDLASSLRSAQKLRHDARNSSDPRTRMETEKQLEQRFGELKGLIDQATQMLHDDDALAVKENDSTQANKRKSLRDNKTLELRSRISELESRITSRSRKTVPDDDDTDDKSLATIRTDDSNPTTIGEETFCLMHGEVQHMKLELSRINNSSKPKSNLRRSQAKKMISDTNELYNQAEKILREKNAEVIPDSSVLKASDPPELLQSLESNNSLSEEPRQLSHLDENHDCSYLDDLSELQNRIEKFEGSVIHKKALKKKRSVPREINEDSDPDASLLTPPIRLPQPRPQTSLGETPLERSREPPVETELNHSRPQLTALNRAASFTRELSFNKVPALARSLSRKNLPTHDYPTAEARKKENESGKVVQAIPSQFEDSAHAKAQQPRQSNGGGADIYPRKDKRDVSEKNAVERRLFSRGLPVFDVRPRSVSFPDAQVELVECEKNTKPTAARTFTGQIPGSEISQLPADSEQPNQRQRAKTDVKHSDLVDSISVANSSGGSTVFELPERFANARDSKRATKDLQQVSQKLVTNRIASLRSTPAGDASIPAMTLWLRKGLVFRRWKRKFASLVSHNFFGQVLCLFDFDSNGEINLHKGKMVVLDEATVRVGTTLEVGGVPRYEFILKVSQSRKTHHLLASTAGHRDSWIDCITNAAETGWADFDFSR